MATLKATFGKSNLKAKKNRRGGINPVNYEIINKNSPNMVDESQLFDCER